MGAVQFIENLDRTSLTVSDDEFEKHVEAAVSAIAERHPAAQSSLPPPPITQPSTSQPARNPSPHLPIPEKSTLSHPEVTPRNSLDAERAAPRRSTSLKNGLNLGGSSSADDSNDVEENAAVAGLLRTIQRPLSTIGRIFSEDNTHQEKQHISQPVLTPQPGSTPRLSPVPAAPRTSDEVRRSTDGSRTTERVRQVQQMSAEDAAARQASAEAEEARRVQRQEHRLVVETLEGMFPNLDREVIDDVVTQKQGRWVNILQVFPHEICFI